MNITCSFVQAVCLAACKKLHEMNAFTDMLLPDRGSGEGEKTEQNEGDPLPGTARHREFYPEGVAEILRVSYLLPRSLSLCIQTGTGLDSAFALSGTTRDYPPISF